MNQGVVCGVALCAFTPLQFALTPRNTLLESMPKEKPYPAPHLAVAEYYPTDLTTTVTFMKSIQTLTRNTECILADPNHLLSPFQVCWQTISLLKSWVKVVDSSGTALAAVTLIHTKEMLKDTLQENTAPKSACPAQSRGAKRFSPTPLTLTPTFIQSTQIWSSSLGFKLAKKAEDHITELKWHIEMMRTEYLHIEYTPKEIPGELMKLKHTRQMTDYLKTKTPPSRYTTSS